MGTRRLLSSPFLGDILGLPYRVLNINHKKELLRGLWVVRSRARGYKSPSMGLYLWLPCPSAHVELPLNLRGGMRMEQRHGILLRGCGLLGV